MEPRRLAGLLVGVLFAAATAALLAAIGVIAAPCCRLWRRWGQVPDEDEKSWTKGLGGRIGQA